MCLIRRTPFERKDVTYRKCRKYSYYVNKYGNPSKGWLCLPDRNLYYADSWGRFYKNRTLEGIRFNGKGAAVKMICAA